MFKSWPQSSDITEILSFPAGSGLTPSRRIFAHINELINILHQKDTKASLKTFQDIYRISILPERVRLEQSHRSYFKGILLLGLLQLKLMENIGAYGQTERRLVGLAASKSRQVWVGEKGELGFCSLNGCVVYWICLSSPSVRWVLHRLGGSGLGSPEVDPIPGRQSPLHPWQVLHSLWYHAYAILKFPQVAFFSFSHKMHTQLCKFVKTRPVFMSANPALRGHSCELGYQSTGLWGFFAFFFSFFYVLLKLD